MGTKGGEREGWVGRVGGKSGRKSEGERMRKWSSV